jgi:copper resistance protein B
MSRIATPLVIGLLLIASDRQAASAQHDDHEPRTPPPAGAASTPPSEEPDHSAHGEPARELPPFIAPVTDADRNAAFPDVEGHTVHDETVHHFVLLDQLEWQSVEGGSLNVDSKAWVGGDRDRLWFRFEGEAADGETGHAEAHVLFGRHASRWWDVVGGVRQDVGAGPSRTWLAFGVQGLAPYWFDVEATAYIGESGRSHLRIETEYELLLTNRLIVQPLVEVEIYGKSDPEREIGAGLSSAEAGLRLRYEVRREFAPYLGITWKRTFFGTADSARASGEGTRTASFTTGVRVWF